MEVFHCKTLMCDPSVGSVKSSSKLCQRPLGQNISGRCGNQGIRNIGKSRNLETKLPVVVFSLEMLDAELSMRILSSEAKVDSKRLRTKNFLDTDLRNIGNAIQGLSQLPIYINDNVYSQAAVGEQRNEAIRKGKK